MWELATHRQPWEQFPTPNYEDVRAAVTSGERPEFDARLIFSEYRELMVQCWNGDPARRPTFEQIFASPLFSSNFVA